jgi:peptidoglycan/xylan/chitin deacetylase (PgdA/CDA1 family)
MSRRIVVFTGSLSFSVRKGIVEIDRAIADLQWLIVIGTPRKSVGQLLRSQWRNLKRNGWRWIPYQAADIWDRVRARRAGPAQPVSIGAQYTSAALQARPNVRTLHVADINSESTCQAVREFAPDIGLSLAAPILRDPLFSIPKLGTLNLHKGKVPAYRGMPPAFWELWNDEQAVGCTVHFVDAKLDTGAILRERSVNRQKYSTLRGLQLQLDEIGVALMREAVAELFDGTSQPVPQPSGGRTYRKPTLAQIATLERKLANDGVPRAPLVKRLLTDTIGTLAFSFWRLGLGRLLAPRITVLLYHRVSDDARDNLTVGIEQFDRQMALLAEHCQVLSIDEVLERTAIERSGKPLVCITFDDGYLDNYENAVPSLVRHQVPAAFFVSTGMIGTNGRFPHDIRRGNPALPTMQWPQLRDMRERGFVIGSHSVTHIDCASEPETVVQRELTTSLFDLRRELGLEKVIFAYPYGGRQHMTPQRLELVKQAGYCGCLSAYGGTNVKSADRFNVLRLGIHWGFSDHALLFACLGLR